MHRNAAVVFIFSAMMIMFNYYNCDSNSTVLFIWWTIMMVMSKSLKLVERWPGRSILTHLAPSLWPLKIQKCQALEASSFSYNCDKSCHSSIFCVQRKCSGLLGNLIKVSIDIWGTLRIDTESTIPQRHPSKELSVWDLKTLLCFSKPEKKCPLSNDMLVQMRRGH